MPERQKSSRKEARRPVWAEVSLGALTENFRAIRRFVNPPEEKRKTPRKILCIVKGNGYGHGGPQVAKALEKAGSDWFGVTCTEEGIAVREAGVRKPVLVLTSFWPGEESRLIEHDLTAVIHRCEQLSQLESAAARRGKKKVSFHLKVDSGMNRLGIAPSSVDCFARQLAKSRHLQLGGVMTHFASSEAFSDTAAGRQTREQEDRFFGALERLRALTGHFPGRHLADGGFCSAEDIEWAHREGIEVYCPPTQSKHGTDPYLPRRGDGAGVLAWRARMARRAAAMIRSAVATLLPPNFCTTRGKGALSCK